LRRTVPCAPRFRSRVFSTPQRLQQLRASRPCFVPQPFLGSSLQSLPLTKIAHPSRGGLLPCSYPPARGSAPLDSLSPPVSSNAHAFARLPASSDDYGLPFQLTEISLPGRPGRQATGSPRLASFTCFEASCSLRESVHRRNGLPHPAGPLLSWASSPLTPSPLTPRSLYPPRPRGPKHAPSPEGSGARLEGPLSPLSRVRPANCNRGHSKQTASAASSPLRG
jgi:hypothetical protein